MVHEKQQTKKFIRLPEVAARTGLSVKALRCAIDRKEFPHTRLGRRVLVSEAELDSFLRGLPSIDADAALEKLR